MATHCPASKSNHNARNDAPVALAADPHTCCPTSHPDDAKHRVLKILVRPGPALVLGESVDAAPEEDDAAVEHLLRHVSPLEPIDTGLHHDEEYDGIGDKS